MKQLLVATIVALSAAALETSAFAQKPTAREIARFERITRRTPLIDGHNDLPWKIRTEHGNDIANVDPAATHAA